MGQIQYSFVYSIGLQCYCAHSLLTFHPNYDCYFYQQCSTTNGQCFTLHQRLETGTEIVESGCIEPNEDQIEKLCNRVSDNRTFRCCATDLCNETFHFGDSPILSPSTEHEQTPTESVTTPPQATTDNGSGTMSI